MHHSERFGIHDGWSERCEVVEGLGEGELATTGLGILKEPRGQVIAHRVPKYVILGLLDGDVLGDF